MTEPTFGRPVAPHTGVTGPADGPIDGEFGDDDVVADDFDDDDFNDDDALIDEEAFEPDAAFQAHLAAALARIDEVRGPAAGRAGRGVRRGAADVAGDPRPHRHQLTGRSDTMARRIRLDAELVRRGLARSREQAAELVAAGRVEVRGTVAGKVAAMVDPADPVLVRGGDPTTEYVSRGGHKLAGALAAFMPPGLVVAGRRCLDAGASTGGFTDVLLRGGAREVVAVDVGYGQLAWPIRTDERVRVHDRTNVRTLTPDDIGGVGGPDRRRPVVHLAATGARRARRRAWPPTATWCRWSSRSSRSAGSGSARAASCAIPALRADAVLAVAGEAAQRGLGVAGVVTSPLPGPSGNVEFFLWLRRGESVVDAGRDPAGGRGRRDQWGDTVTRAALLVTHTGRKDSTEHARAVAARPDRRRVSTVRVIAEEAERPGDPRGGPGGGADAAEGVEIVCALGGDGTLLRAAELARPAKAPLFGINLGQVGFLAEAEIADLDEAVRDLVARDYTVDERLTVDVTVEHGGEVVGESWALNEVTVEKGDRERMLELLVEVDGRALSRYGCDGVVCATPTGSTAYAFSAGGPVVWPEVEALLLVPISAHALFSRALVTAPTSTITVTVDPYGPGAVVSCDGRRSHRVAPGATATVRRGALPVRVVRLQPRPFTDRLVAKFALPVDGWRNRANGTN